MAYVDDVADTLVDAINAMLAPYQPNLPPDYINAAPTAGTIPSTLTAPGHSLQFNVMLRLENKQSTIVVYDGKVETAMPFLNETDHLPLMANGDGTFSSVSEVSRSIKEFVIEIWTYNQDSRKVLSDLVRGFFGDFLRLTEADGTTTIHRYTRTVKHDTEQRDSLYINQIYLMSDMTVTTSSPSYVMTKPNLTVDIDDPNNDLLDTLQPPQY